MAEPFSPEQQDNLNRFMELITSVNREMDPLVQAEKEAAERVRKANDEFKKLSETLKQQLGDSSIRIGKAMLNTEPGLNKFSEGVTGASDAVGNFAMAMGGAWKVVGIFIKAMGSLVGASLKQNDDMMKSYQTLSDMSYVVSGGFDGLLDQLHRVGLVASEAEKFEKALKPVTGEMVLFGGSVTKGSEKLVGVIQGLVGPNNELEKTLLRLGYTTQDIREGAADFVQRQTKLGRAQSITTGDLIRQSFRYLQTMKELQELTGMTRDEQQKARDAQLADARMTLHLTKLHGDDAENLSNYLLAYEQRFGKEAAAGLKDRIVNQGRITTDLAAASYQSAATAYDDAMRAQKGGTKVFMESLTNTAGSIRKRLRSVEGSFMITEGGLKDMGLTSEAVNGAIGLTDVNSKEYAETLKNLNDIGKKNEGQLNNNILNEQKMRAMRIAADTMVAGVGELVVGMFTKLIDIGYKFAKFMANMIDKFSKVVLGKQTNLSASFREYDDVIQDEKLAKRKIKQLNEELADSISDYKLAMEGKKGVEDQLKEQRQIIDNLEKRKDDKNLSELERARAEVSLIAAEKRLKLLDEEWAQTRKLTGGTDFEKLKIIRMKRYNELEVEGFATEKELQELKKEKIEKAKRQSASIGTMDFDTGVKAVGNQSANVDIKGQQISKEKMAQRQSAQNSLQEIGATRSSDEILSKIKFRDRDENTGGGGADPALLALAERIQQAIPGSMVTGMNDLYHKINVPGSRHTQGKALDFVLPERPTPDQAKLIKEQLKDLGAAKVMDEYYQDKNKNTKGEHFHVEVARFGGLFSGPEQGYPIMMHGKKESAWPERELKGLLKEVQKSSLSQYKKELMQEMGLDTDNTSSAGGTNLNNDRLSSVLVETLTAKLDAVISRLDKSNGIQDDILTYTKA